MNCKIDVYICEGFSHFFLPIKMDSFHISKFRTALIVKSSLCLDTFITYTDFFKSVIVFIANKFNACVEVSFSDNKYIAVESYNNLTNLIHSNAIKNKGLRTYQPIKFRFIKDKNTKFLLSIDDWTDIDLIDVYSNSCVLSFHSTNDDINNRIGEYLNEFTKINSNNINNIKRIDEFGQPHLIWYFLNKIWMRKRLCGNNIRDYLSNNNQVETIVSSGFNLKNELPVKLNISKTLFRTGFIIKKRAFTDDINLYSNLIFQAIINVNKLLSTNCFINTKYGSKKLQTISDWYTYLDTDDAKNQEFDTYYPIRIYFEKNGNIVSEAILEDWSAVECDNSDLYKESYILSFYTFETHTNDIISKEVIDEIRNNSIVGLVSEITEELSPKWYWRYMHKVLNQNHMYKMRRHSRLSKNENIEIYICKGFNRYCSTPKLNEHKKQMFRTALIIKKEDFYDNWEITYNNIFWEFINNLVLNMSVDLEIVEVDNSSLYVPFNSWKNTFKSKTNISIDELDELTEIRIIKENEVICIISLENWSDSPDSHPYNWSYTYSFYTNDEQIDKTINKILSSSINSISSIELVDTIQEYPKPKWYWKYMGFLKILKEWVLVFLITALFFFILYNLAK